MIKMIKYDNFLQVEEISENYLQDFRPRWFLWRQFLSVIQRKNDHCIAQKKDEVSPIHFVRADQDTHTHTRTHKSVPFLNHQVKLLEKILMNRLQRYIWHGQAGLFQNAGATQSVSISKERKPKRSSIIEICKLWPSSQPPGFVIYILPVAASELHSRAE